MRVPGYGLQKCDWLNRQVVFVALLAALFTLIPAPLRAAGTLEFSRSSLGFGNVAIGSSSAISVKITNTGKESVVFSQALLQAKEFSLIGFVLPKTLDGERSLTFIVKFSPSYIGVAEGTIEFVSNATNRRVTVGLKGSGVTGSSSLSGTISATPGNVDFEGVPVGTTNTQTVEVRNDGKTEVTISSVNVSGDGFKASGLALPHNLSAGGIIPLHVEFTPTKEVERAGRMVISGNSGHVIATVNLSGSGIADTRSLAAPASVTFGNVFVGKSATLHVQVKNTGNSAIKISGVTVSGAGFSATGISPGLTIGAQSTAVLAIEWAPKTVGNVSGDIVVTSNAANSKLTVALSGTGTSTSGYEVQLGWQASSSPEVAGYYVYRSNTSSGPYARIVASPVDATQYVDASVQPGQSYYYFVTALNVEGIESTPSNKTAVTIP